MRCGESCGRCGAHRSARKPKQAHTQFVTSSSPRPRLVNAPHRRIGFVMRVYRSVLSVAGVLVAIPATVVGVDTVFRWKPTPDVAIAQRVDASKDLDAY